MPKRLIGSSVDRRRFLRTTAAAGGTMALATALPWYARAQTPGIALGQLSPFTGALAEFGGSFRDAVALAVEQLNAAGEDVFGGPIIARHIAEDTNALPTPGVNAARKLVETDGVPAIVGAASSGVTVAAASSVTIPAGVLMISNASTSPLISVLPEDREADLLFRTTAPDTFQGVVLAQLLSGEIFPEHRFATAATIYVNNPYGQGLSNAFARSFQLRGGTVTAQVPHPEEVQPTYTSQLALALKDEPDILVCVGYAGHTASYLKECRDIFGFTSWAFVDGNKSMQVHEAVGGADLAGSFGTTPGQDPGIPGFRNLAAAMQERFDRDSLLPFTESAYDAAVTIGLAAAKAIADGESELTGQVLRDRLRGVANPPGETVVGGSQEEIARAVRAIAEGRDIDYAGAAGACNYDAAGDVITPQAIWKFTEAGVETVEVVTADSIPPE